MSNSGTTDRVVHKEDILESIVHSQDSALRKYQHFFVGTSNLWSLFRYELAQCLASPVPGALGFVLRKMLQIPLLGQTGRGVQIGRNVSVRHPGKIHIGDRSAIDDLCLLDARGIRGGEFRIGADVLIARGTVVASKTDKGTVDIGDHCVIGKNCGLISSGGIRIGKWVGLADTCYIGGGRYRTDRLDLPMIKQEPYTKGLIEIGDDCWIGTGVTVLDGVKIGRGSIIGAGAVIREDVPEYTMVAPHQRLVMLPRITEEKEEASQNHVE